MDAIAARIACDFDRVPNLGLAQARIAGTCAKRGLRATDGYRGRFGKKEKPIPRAFHVRS
jgi:hypothetical protein